MATHQDLPVILHNEKRGLLTIEDGHLDVLQLSKDGRPPKRLLSSPMRYFLRAHLAPAATGSSSRLDLHTLIAKGRHLRLSKMHVLVEPVNLPEAEEWVNTAMTAAYDVTKPSRRVLLLVNPVGGKGKSRAIVRETVVPLLQSAGCLVDLRETTHRLHAEEIAREIDLVYDVIATASGDGLVYEVLNGLASRPDAKKALKIPVAPIPTGSANALCINLFGPKDTFNIELACLNIIKGISMPKDMCSILLLPSNERRWSFLATAIGLMVDLDIGTENIRWVGDSRFFLGFLRGIVTNRNHKCRIRMKVVNEDKIEMARGAREWAASVKGKKVVGGGVDPLVDGVKQLRVEGLVNGGTVAEGKGEVPRPPGETSAAHTNGSTAGGSNEGPDEEGGYPDAKPLEPDDSWTTIETGSKTSISQAQRDAVSASTGQSGGWIHGEGVLYAYAGHMPWVARDLMQWPVARNNTGVMDMVIQSIVPRATLVNAITGAEHGEAYWQECQHYYQISAYTCENLDPARQKLFTIDGEAFPYETFHVELYPGMANVLSLDGHYFVSEFLQRHDNKA